MHETDISLIEYLPHHRWEEYRDLWIAAVTVDPAAFAETPEEVDAYPPEKWQDNLDRQGLVLVFAEVDGNLVGMGAISKHPNQNFGHNAFMRKLFVRPEWRRKGIGTLLIERRLELMKSMGVKNVLCEIIETQTESIRLHESLGFSRVGVLPDFTNYNGDLISEVILHRKV